LLQRPSLFKQSAFSNASQRDGDWLAWLGITQPVMPCDINEKQATKILIKIFSYTQDDAEQFVHRAVNLHQSLCRTIENELSAQHQLACLNGWRVTSVLGCGAFGCALGLTASDGSGQTAAMKLAVDRDLTFMDEVLAQRAFAAAGLAPKILGQSCTLRSRATNTNVAIGGVVMERISGTLNSYLTKRNEEIENSSEDAIKALANDIASQIFYILDSLRHYNLTHGDMHFGNIGFTYDPSNTVSGIKLTLIDFGYSAVGLYFPYVDYLQTGLIYTPSNWFSLIHGATTLQNKKLLAFAQFFLPLLHTKIVGLLQEDPASFPSPKKAAINSRYRKSLADGRLFLKIAWQLMVEGFKLQNNREELDEKFIQIQRELYFIVYNPLRQAYKNTPVF